MTLPRAAATGAAFALGAIASTVAAAVLGVLVVDALARGALPRALQRELRFSYGGGRKPAVHVPDDAREQFGAH